MVHFTLLGPIHVKSEFEVEVEHAAIQDVFATWKRPYAKGRKFARVLVALALHSTPNLSKATTKKSLVDFTSGRHLHMEETWSQ